MTDSRARYGWESDFPEFSSTSPKRIREALKEFVADASPEQVRAPLDASALRRARYLSSRTSM